MSGSLAARLAGLAGAANVIDDEGERAYYGHDIAGPPPYPALLVVRPPSVDAALACVAAITGAGHALTMRGGGHSCTGGYGPTRPGTVILDTCALDRVVEIDEAGGRVTVEVVAPGARSTRRSPRWGGAPSSSARCRASWRRWAVPRRRTPPSSARRGTGRCRRACSASTWRRRAALCCASAGWARGA